MVNCILTSGCGGAELTSLIQDDVQVLGVQHHTCATAVVGDGCTFYQEADLDTSMQTIKADALERNKIYARTSEEVVFNRILPQTVHFKVPSSEVIAPLSPLRTLSLQYSCSQE
ncbi:hypothetical protein AV530_002710 [Patagioenas fasciata monilis]|uniref:Uncharacterized protein n=1 Tax=Patagioenas fasciata monilis TaxID=372326 RepID=A0A1V4IQE5_PATFA|nr:hypothetical protein AV530_002710 [Patagioenas fasciata monilis]